MMMEGMTQEHSIFPPSGVRYLKLRYVRFTLSSGKEANLSVPN